MIEREVARRVFAHEFNHSDYFFHEGDERSPNYLLTPTGAKINRLYIVGVLTEFDNIGVEEDMWRGRVSDPTGAFTIYAGQYQPEAALFLSRLDIPSFVAMVGKARTFEPEKGTLYTSMRPEELNISDGSIRDRWIVDTARLTFERIRLVRAALQSRLNGEHLVTMLVQSGASTDLADGINRALTHYTHVEQYLNTLSTAIIAALHTLLPADYMTTVNTGISVRETDENTSHQYQMKHSGPKRSEPPVIVETDLGTPLIKTSLQYSMEDQHLSAVKEQAHTDSARIITEEVKEDEPDAEETVYELMGKLDSGKGVPVTKLMKESKRCGLPEYLVDDAVKALMSEGRCYEPRIGLLRKV